MTLSTHSNWYLGAGRAKAAEALGQVWDAQTLRAFLRFNFPNDQLIVASQRQPYSHSKTVGGARWAMPASGLVTAMAPVMKACAGTWVAHATGDADAEVVDEEGVWITPSDAGAYRLKRLWFNEQDQSGHLDGFSNSGLWPLCHESNLGGTCTSPVQPHFTEDSWTRYRRVNQAYADAIVEESSCANPLVMVHDYQLALVPGLVRKQLPQATIIAFWHIPWASHSQMSLCPWLDELIAGWLGSDVVGFQTPRHRDNFLESVRLLGGRPTVGNTRAVVGTGHTSHVGHYPVSVAWPSEHTNVCKISSEPVSRRLKLIVGIDRFDYTKGLLERLKALEVLLLVYPEWTGRVRLVQVAAPTRGALPAYEKYRAEVQTEVLRINTRFSSGDWQPVTLLDTHHDPDEVNALYRAADVCLVTSLQDGMNLVCKEFIAARADESGVLVLSTFAGASDELTSALPVNPLNPDEVASALHQALTMPETEVRRRMRELRRNVEKNNVHRWAASLFADAARSRLAQATSQVAGVRLPTESANPHHGRVGNVYTLDKPLKLSTLDGDVRRKKRVAGTVTAPGRAGL